MTTACSIIKSSNYDQGELRKYLYGFSHYYTMVYCTISILRYNWFSIFSGCNVFACEDLEFTL